MDIQIQGQDRVLPIHSVFTTKNTANIKNVYMFHCYSCGASINRIKGKIIQVRAGEAEESEHVAAISECPRCHKNYIVISLEKNNIRPIKLTLVYDPFFLPNKLYCVICREFLGYYTPESFTTPTRTIQHPLPYQFICTRRGCGCSYLLEDVVSSTMTL